MLKKLLIAVAFAFPMLASAQTLKIGLVNTGDIFQAMPDTKAAQTKLQDIEKKYQEEYKRLETEFNRMVEELQKAGENELPAIRERKTREIQDYQQKVQAFEQSAAADMQKKQQELMAPIIQKMRTAIEAVGKENGFGMIQNYSPDQTIYFADPVQDITPLVKAKLGLGK